MRSMKVYCPECGERAIIKKIKREGLNVPELYCACDDVECGHTYVLKVSFSHTIKQSKYVIDPSNHVLKLYSSQVGRP
ncbi:ogr/Delta-like zinc finger family protein [Providencia stuartii]|uniref:ogr/Delta-like zinc finger family protein n=1 Tax=Providencia TaxID=586 RepID=UPI0013D31DA2|nr:MULTISPECIES: ogr/Delta-like zinc finger family protein [Providencia]MCR4081293.1 ogr/Delta-like zinc finger family protein [Providencia stuartii]